MRWVECLLGLQGTLSDNLFQPAKPAKKAICPIWSPTCFLFQLLKEKERRMSLGAASKRRKELISAKYRPLHPHVYTLQVRVTVGSKAKQIEQPLSHIK